MGSFCAFVIPKIGPHSWHIRRSTSPNSPGYDAVAIARGRALAGHPLFWAIIADRLYLYLYLFYSDKNRDAFLADPGATPVLTGPKLSGVVRTIAR